MKTKKVARKRFKLTKTGKIMHRVQGRRHLRRKKSQGRKRRQDGMVQIKNARFSKKLRSLLGT